MVLVYPGEFNFGFSFSCIFRDRKKPASSLQAIGKYCSISLTQVLQVKINFRTELFKAGLR